MESNAREKFHEETGRQSGELRLSVIPVYEDSQYVPVLPQITEIKISNFNVPHKS